MVVSLNCLSVSTLDAAWKFCTSAPAATMNSENITLQASYTSIGGIVHGVGRWVGNPFRLILDEAEKALTPSALQNRVKIVKAVIDTMRKAKEISHITLVSLRTLRGITRQSPRLHKHVHSDVVRKVDPVVLTIRTV